MLLSFSAGARRCIGEYFSFIEMQMHLAVLAPRFALRQVTDSGHGVELDPAVNLRSRASIHLQVSPRNRLPESIAGITPGVALKP
ncbi:MAG: hypothetical protein R3F24_05440 [Gammaproteobacteria bacterium]